MTRRPETTRRGRGNWLWCGAAAAMVTGLYVAAHVRGAEGQAAGESSAEPIGVTKFKNEIAPLLEIYCLDCHGDGVKKGNVSLDEFATPEAALADKELWRKVLKMIRSDLMPPKDEIKPEAQEIEQIEQWVKYSVFEIDPQRVDPGRATVRRLNRVEYTNTVRDLMGVEFNAEEEFPADDSGHGFDNNADVLTISPLLLEKYLDAAKQIVSRTVPTAPLVVAERVVGDGQFKEVVAEVAAEAPAAEANADGAQGQRQGQGQGGMRRGGGGGVMTMSYYEPKHIAAEYEIEREGDYQLVLNLRAQDRYVDTQFDYNEANLILIIDGEQVLEQKFVRQGGREYAFKFDRRLAPGKHTLDLKLVPLTQLEQVRSLNLRIEDVTVRGPLDEKHWVKPAGYERWFSGEVPAEAAARREYARGLLEEFASRAFRRPVDSETVDRLLAIVETVERANGGTFEMGVAQAMTAVLASPRFLFREEGLIEGDDRYPLVDEYSLASRLSYFLWSTMPDERLMELASMGQLRANLDAEVERMLADERSDEFVSHFVGQWLKARDVESVAVNAFAVIRRDQAPDPEADRLRERFRELRRKDPEQLTEDEKKELETARQSFFGRGRGPRIQFEGPIRRAMRQETEMTFEYILREDRSVLELIDSNYTFLNQPLAEFYELQGVEVSGNQMRRVELPEGSHRGGILTQGTVLVVTSNPDRTSPVKRGLYLLENILGTPPAPPPPDIPSLEEAERAAGKPLSLRETLALHREDALCSSCHERMDPLGLALENYNALGRWRETDRQTPIDAKGELVTGEAFESVADLKKILVTERRDDFYHTVTEKLMMYALGRGVGYSDTETVDDLVDGLRASGGSLKQLVVGVIESPQFQRSRRPGEGEDVAAATGE